MYILVSGTLTQSDSVVSHILHRQTKLTKPRVDSTVQNNDQFSALDERPKQEMLEKRIGLV